MIRIFIICDTYKHFEGSIKEYEKRLWKEVEIIKLKPSKKKEIKEIVKEETIMLSQKLQWLKWYKILLYINWKQFSTESFFELIEQKKQAHSDINFIIWGAYWVDDSFVNEVDLKFSMSEMTFPHSMAFMILLEQIYRVSMIKKGSWYHH